MLYCTSKLPLLDKAALLSSRNVSLMSYFGLSRLMIKTEDMILINDHNGYLLTAVGAKKTKRTARGK